MFVLDPCADHLYRIGRIIGTGIFSTPSSITAGVGSVGAAMMLWLLGLILSFCGLMVWLEFGCMFPKSGGEKVYLEAVYRRPRFFATAVFAIQAIFLGFTGMDIWLIAALNFDKLTGFLFLQPPGASSSPRTWSWPPGTIPESGRNAALPSD
jgi:amino acid transporter